MGNKKKSIGGEAIRWRSKNRMGEEEEMRRGK